MTFIGESRPLRQFIEGSFRARLLGEESCEALKYLSSSDFI
jgi:hypothetical protein